VPGVRPAEILSACANGRAADAARRNDWDTAIAALRRGRLDDPASDVLRANLGAMVHNLVVGYLGAKRCAAARAYVAGLPRLRCDAIVDDVQRLGPALP